MSLSRVLGGRRQTAIQGGVLDGEETAEDKGRGREREREREKKNRGWRKDYEAAKNGEQWGIVDSVARSSVFAVVFTPPKLASVEWRDAR